MQILFESIKSTQISMVASIISLLEVIALWWVLLKIVSNKKIKRRIIMAWTCLIIMFGISINTINQRFNYETIHTKKITFTEQQNFKVNDEITIYPEIKGYKVINIEGKIYTVELREKAK